MRCISPYAIADIINGMKQGMCWKIDGHEVRNIAGSDVILPSGRTGWEIVLDNVIGSSYETEWTFYKHMDGSITVCRVGKP